MTTHRISRQIPHIFLTLCAPGVIWISAHGLLDPNTSLAPVKLRPRRFAFQIIAYCWRKLASGRLISLIYIDMPSVGRELARDGVHGDFAVDGAVLFN